jgi:hypothetical protein
MSLKEFGCDVYMIFALFHGRSIRMLGVACEK